MQTEARKLLEDMRMAALGIMSAVKNRTIEDYRSDMLFRWSVERGFEITGEALSQLRKLDPGLASSISDHRSIISFRNILVHAYSIIDNDKTWDIAIVELPLLLKEVEALLQKPA